MRYLFAIFLSMVGLIVIFYGEKPVKIKKGKIIETIDSLNDRNPKKFVYFQRIMIKVVLGLSLIFFSIMIALGRL